MKKETKDVIDYLNVVSKKLKEAKADDAVISNTEILKIAFTTAPAGVKALMGITDIDDEFKSSTDEEKDELLKACFEIVQSLAETFNPAG